MTDTAGDTFVHGTEAPAIKVTKIRNRWHARLLYGSRVRDEMACECQQDINWICRELLRWDSKMGGTSKFSDVGRHKFRAQPIGKVWYGVQLADERTKRKAGKKP